MQLHLHPELLDRLAASYALGTLRGGARRRFETMARHNPAIRASALLWQERFSAMTELQRVERPHDNVWKRIENMVAAEARPAAPPKPAPPRAPGWWRWGALAGGLATVAAIAVSVGLRQELAGRELALAQERDQGRLLVRQNAELSAQLQAQPEIRYVSVLHDDKAGVAILATFDPRHSRLTLKRVADIREGDRSLQLWALPPGAAPQSLGVLTEEAVMRISAPEQQVRGAPTLAVSLEPKGGVPGERGPTGPVLFKGAVLQTPV